MLCRFGTEDIVVPTSNDVRNFCLIQNLLKDEICVQLLMESRLLPSNSTAVDVEVYLRAFQCNNFAISDSLMIPLAAGVYPIGSLLNHECIPNCILTYNPKTHIQVSIDGEYCGMVTYGRYVTYGLGLSCITTHKTW